MLFCYFDSRQSFDSGWRERTCCSAIFEFHGLFRVLFISLRSPSVHHPFSFHLVSVLRLFFIHLAFVLHLFCIHFPLTKNGMHNGCSWRILYIWDTCRCIYLLYSSACRIPGTWYTCTCTSTAVSNLHVCVSTCTWTCIYSIMLYRYAIVSTCTCMSSLSVE